MSRLRGWIKRLGRSLRPGRFEAEMADEMRAHQEWEAEALRARGLDEAAARRLAAMRFGSSDSVQETVRQRRFAQVVHEFVADARQAIRHLRHAPGFTAVAVATLGLGIGGSTTMFSTLDGLLFRPLPYPEPERLALLFEVIPPDRINSASGGVFLDWRAHQTSFEGISLAGEISRNARYGTVLERLNGTEATHELFSVLGVQPLFGRTFLPSEDQPGGNPHVVVVTEEWWRSRLGGAVDALGTTIVLDEVPHTLIGVVPRDALVPETQFYVPAVAHPSPDGKYSRNFHWATVVGRLRPGVTFAQAERELQAIKQRLDADYPVWKKDWSAAVRAPRPLLAARTGPVALALLGAVAIVLLIACANVANLLLARAARRQPEFALRAALGATTSRLMRQVLTESLVLALLGGAAGALLASWAIHLLRTATASMLPPALAPQLDGRVLAATLLVAIATGLFFGALPAWRARRVDVNSALKDGGRSATAGRRGGVQGALIVAEVALSIVLLTSAGLLLRSLAKAVASDPGFQPERVLAFDLSLPAVTYPTPESRLQLSVTLQERLRALPGVENVGTAMSLPFAGGGYGEAFTPVERTPSYGDPTGRLDFVSPGYLETLNARLLAGRWIEESDNRADGPRVAVINDVVAKQLYGGEMPVGRSLRIGSQLYEIIGVIGRLPDRQKDAPSPLFAYVPQAFDPSSFSVVVRARSQPDRLVPHVQDVLRQLDPGLPLGDLRVLDQAMVGSMKLRRLIFVLIATFALSSLILACVGLYGVMSYVVATRTRELSIRLALGASPREVVRLVLAGGMKLVLMGVGIGLALTLVSTGYLRAQLYDVSVHDPLAIVASIAVLVAVAAAACWWPARRATQSDALAALRAE